MWTNIALIYENEFSRAINQKGESPQFVTCPSQRLIYRTKWNRWQQVSRCQVEQSNFNKNVFSNQGLILSPLQIVFVAMIEYELRSRCSVPALLKNRRELLTVLFALCNTYILIIPEKLSSLTANPFWNMHFCMLSLFVFHIRLIENVLKRFLQAYRFSQSLV